MVLWITSPMNLRKTPGGDMVVTLMNGFRIEVIQYLTLDEVYDQFEDYNGGDYDYLAIKYNGEICWLAYIEENYTDVNPANPSEDNPKRYWVADPMNIRKAPDGELITTLPIGTEIMAIGYLTKAETNTQYDWLVIEYAEGENGIAYMAYIADKLSTTNINSMPTPQNPWTMWVIADMNIRTTPGGDRITTLPGYTEITVIGYLTKAETNSEYDWLIIEYETAEEGIAYMAYLEENLSYDEPD